MAQKSNCRLFAAFAAAYVTYSCITYCTHKDYDYSKRCVSCCCCCAVYWLFLCTFSTRTHTFIYKERARDTHTFMRVQSLPPSFFSYIFVMLIFRFIFISFPFICYCPSRYLLLYALHCSCSLAHSLTHAHSIGFSAAFS